MQDTATKSAAETRADEIAEYAESLGHLVERTANPTDDLGATYEVIVVGKWERVQVIVRQSKFPSKSSLWAQRIDTMLQSSRKARKVAAGDVKRVIRAIAPRLAEAAAALTKGQAVQNTRTGELGVFESIEAGMARVRFATGDPWDAATVNPHLIAPADLAATRRSVGYYEPSCPSCAQYVDADEQGNTLPHLRTDSIYPSVCQGSGRPRFEREVPADYVRADLLNAAGEPFGPDDLATSAFVIDGTRYPAESTDDDGVRAALAAAGYTLARRGSLWDNFINGCTQLLIVPTPAGDEPETVESCDGFSVGDVVRWTAGADTTTEWRIDRIYVPRDADRRPYAGMTALNDPGPGTRGTAGGLHLLVHARQADEQHATQLSGPDSSGHYSWRCIGGDNAEQAGLELVDAIRTASEHGPLSVGSWGLIKRLRGDDMGAERAAAGIGDLRRRAAAGDTDAADTLAALAPAPRPADDEAADPILAHLNARAALIADVLNLVDRLTRHSRASGEVAHTGRIADEMPHLNMVRTLRGQVRARLTDLLEADERAAMQPAGDDAACRFCGCTENRACPGGCAWAGDAELTEAGIDPIEGDVCTACVALYRAMRAAAAPPRPDRVTAQVWHLAGDRPPAPGKSLAGLDALSAAYRSGMTVLVVDLKGADVAEWLKPWAEADRCPDPAAHVPECAEDDHDHRGDCDGEVLPVRLKVARYGHVPGERVLLCGAHRRQALAKREAVKVVQVRGRSATACEARSDSITDIGDHAGAVALARGPASGELIYMCSRHRENLVYWPAKCAAPEDRGDHAGAIVRATLTAAGGRLVDRFGTSPGDPIALCEGHAGEAAEAGEIEPVTATGGA